MFLPKTAPKTDDSMRLQPWVSLGHQDDASTVVKYQSYGRKHEELFQTNGLVLEKAIDPRTPRRCVTGQT